MSENLALNYIMCVITAQGDLGCAKPILLPFNFLSRVEKNEHGVQVSPSTTLLSADRSSPPQKETPHPGAVPAHRAPPPAPGDHSYTSGFYCFACWAMSCYGKHTHWRPPRGSPLLPPHQRRSAFTGEQQPTGWMAHNPSVYPSADARLSSFRLYLL